MKLIAALHGPGLPERLLSPALRTELARAGASRLQVNLDDADVADAMRFGPGVPVTALLSVWDADVAAALDVVRRLDAGAAAWLVAERTPLSPPPVPDGERAPALANVALLRRPASMTPEAWLGDWLERHTQVAIDTQATFGYLQHPVLEHLTESGRDVHGIVEELFDMAAMSDPHAFYGSRGDDAELQRRLGTLMDSCARFGAADGLDLVPTSRYLFGLTTG
ncbi:EthD domain-containing protein [Nocardioides sp. zg-536]|uniref:EthD domain-containing protein n=1 Tax=Nocardioides faecalis TaxID=2803858 RepID=A0A938YB38_9ACTN|nr:EthD domain-containing protein [Nocardioides faecalis]MBM9461393.1 EthD domain-containing protein [Nocardioides faecalis]QVI57654.1 EthD domain-containing protein [Nocardioides faecalis]